MKEIIEKAGKIIESLSGTKAEIGKEPYCVIAVIDENNYPSASTITVASNNGIEELYLCTGLSSNKAKRIAKNNKASICFSSLTYNITLVGTIEILTDDETKKANWYDGLSHNFKDGVKDMDLCVLKFSTNRYNIFVDYQLVQGTIK